MPFTLVPRIVRADGEEEWLPQVGAAGLPLAAGVSFGRGGVPDANPALRRIPVDPRWLDRRPGDHAQVPRQLLVVVPDGPDGVRWWIKTGHPQAFRIHVGPYAGQAAPPWVDSGSIALPEGASSDIEVWIAARRGWRPVLRARVERTAAAGRDRRWVPGVDEPTSGPAESVAESALKAWIQEDLGEVQRRVLWAGVQAHGQPRLREAVQASTGVPDIATKWASIARSLGRFVDRHRDPATGLPWLQNLIEYPGLADHVLHGRRLRSGEEEVRAFSQFLARFPNVPRWGW